MHPKSVLPVTILLAVALVSSGATAPQGSPDTSAQIKALFADPPRQYSSAPLWVWNDLLTEEQVIDTLRSLAAQKVKQAFVHPRPGLMTPYLSPDWFRLWKAALKEAERLDMNLWIYDENSYPSGFAGGFVPEAMPESRGRGLGMRETGEAPKWQDDTLAVFRLTDNGYEDVTSKIRGGQTLPAARYLEISIMRAKPGPWYGGKWYVDLLYPGVTQKFLSVTLDAYKRELGSQFGNRVPGSFTDEPQLRPAGGIPWTDDLPQLFEKRWGYRLIDHLPALREPIGDWKRVRHNYLQLLLELFIERWAKPYYEYCAKNGIEFTGHYWEHEWPNCFSVPDNMAMNAWQQRPGIDILMNQYNEGPHAQFGNVRSVKELSSVANQLGRPRTLCEGYGAGGWDLRFEDMKRIGDWLYVLGVNTLDQHLSYVSLRGARKRDHPQSFSYHEPWWEAYHTSAEYFSRLTLALAKGQEINPILVIEPTTTAWMYNAASKNPPELDKLGEEFQKLVTSLAREQVEFDIGDEDILSRNGSVTGASLCVGQRMYSTVVLPPFSENLNTATMQLLEAFLRGGGRVLSCSNPPERMDGQKSGRGAALSREGGWKQLEVSTLTAMLAALGSDGFSIRRNPNDRGILYHQRRRIADGEVLFLVNTSIESASSGVVESPESGIERWDLDRGKIENYPFEAAQHGVRAKFDLPPSGSLLLFLTHDKRKPEEIRDSRPTTVPTLGPPEMRRTAPNVLILDYLDITAGGEATKDVYFYQASQFAFKQNGMARNPWDSAVQFRDELITKKFPQDSGVQAAYRFKISGRVPATLVAVVERPDLYTIECNGKTVKAVPGEWWLDKSFGKIDISSAAVTGENTLVLKASPFTIFHEIESVYILGDFALRPAESGFVIVPDSVPNLGAWNSQGYPFYAQGVEYTQKYRLDSPRGRYRVSLPKWYGSVAKVIVNGKPAGYVSSPPWECDITDLIQAGHNSVQIVVMGTLKNTLGPHHGNPALGTAWPAMFQKAPYPGPPPGAQYSTVGYGLMEPFRLLQVQ
ncbi:MAG TPA: glycosyl hydrolase [Acidobacteriota bacterium]|nr:glycosyl hydrolase [Acidobacteriota bacterium]